MPILLCLKGKAKIPTDDLIQEPGVAEINTQWPIRLPLQEKTPISKAFFPIYRELE